MLTKINLGQAYSVSEDVWLVCSIYVHWHGKSADGRASLRTKLRKTFLQRRKAVIKTCLCNYGLYRSYIY